MVHVIYEVHSDCDENNIFSTFTGRGSKQEAIAYARRNAADMTWVDKVLYDDRTEEYEYCGGVWNYADEE